MGYAIKQRKLYTKLFCETLPHTANLHLSRVIYLPNNWKEWKTSRKLAKQGRLHHFFGMVLSAWKSSGRPMLVKDKEVV